MTIRSRRILFYGLFALFLVMGTGIAFYAQGWRFDFMTFKTEKVGAIYVESHPENAEITLNGKPIQNASGFLSHGTLISNLFPKNYILSLKAPGYDAWSENARVAPTLVTEMKYAVLVPSNASSVSPIANVTDFFEAGGNVVTEASDGTIARATTTIVRGTIVSHGSDFATIVTQSAKGGYSAYDLLNGTSTNLSALLASAGATRSAISAVIANPYDDASIFAETPRKFYAIDLAGGGARNTVTAFATAPVGESLETPLAISSSWLAWAQYHVASDTSQIVVYDPFSGDTIDSSLSIPGTVASLKWVRGTLLGILGADGSLYRYDIPSETLTKMADDVKSFFPTDDGSTVAALEGRSVEIFSLTLPADQGGYYRFNLPDMGSVRSLAWYRDNSHLFVAYPTHVNFLDLADLSLRNLTEISALAPETDPFYDASQNSLYLIDQGWKLIRFDFPS